MRVIPVFQRNCKSVEFCFILTLILTKLFQQIFYMTWQLWHVVACAKNCCDLMSSNWITARRSFHRIWIASQIRWRNSPLVRVWNKIIYIFFLTSHLRITCIKYRQLEERLRQPDVNWCFVYRFVKGVWLFAVINAKLLEVCGQC